MLDNYSCVRLLTDRYGDQGAHAGDQSYIIEVHENAYEVEFADGNGIDFAQIVAREEEWQAVKTEPSAPQPFGNIAAVDTREISTPSGTPPRKRLPSIK